MNPAGGWGNAPANAGTSARVNRAQVLRLIQMEGPTSRPELGRRTGLTPGTISNVIRDLAAQRLVSPTGEKVRRLDAAAGIAATLLGLDLSWHRVLAVHQGVSRIRVGAADLAGNLVGRVDLRPRAGEPWESMLERLAAAIGRLVAGEGWAVDQVRGLGMGAVGLVDGRSGVVREAPNLGWRDVPLRERLAASLPWPVTVGNNVHAMALGERRFGPAREEYTLYVYVGSGIGSGMMAGDHVLSGAHGAAGELGHIIVPGGGPCSCGKTGCLETVAAEPAIAARALAALPGLDEGVAGRPDELASGWHKAVVTRLVERARAGDPVAVRLVAEAGADLGRALAQVIELLDPETIVLGGALAEAGELFLGPAAASLSENSFVARGREVRVRAAGFGLDSGLVGAAALALDAFVYSSDAALLADRPSRLAAR